MWVYSSKYGPVYIKRHSNGLYHIIFDGDSLGGYHNPQQALDDAVGGHTFTPSNGIELDEFGLPGDLSLWQQMA